MTQQEYNDWLNHTEFSQYQWLLDEVTLHNKAEMLFYRGGTQGQYFKITPKARLEVGVYTGAIPHIGEAIFRRIGKGDYGSQQEALHAAYNAGLTRVAQYLIG